MPPETRYARSGELHIAYQVVGSGPIDLVYVPSWISQVEHYWEEPGVARYLERLASFSRLILFDRRGSGLSDPVLRAPTLEEQMDDVVAVMDAAGSQQAAVFAQLEGGAMAALFAATHPERTSALVLYEAMPRMSWAPDYDWALRREERRVEGGPSRRAARSPRRATRRRRSLGRRLSRDRARAAVLDQSAYPPVVCTARAARSQSRDRGEAVDDERRGRCPRGASVDLRSDARAPPR